VNEWVIVGIVAVVVIFGINKLPQIARNLGKAQNEFKQGLKEGADTDAPAEGSKPADKPPTA
jgi:sec-independent protein translocase protein TatA